MMAFFKMFSAPSNTKHCCTVVVKGDKKLVIKREARLVKVTVCSKILVIREAKTRKEENSVASDLTTCRPELH